MCKEATLIKFEETMEYGNLFRIQNSKDSFWVKSYENGNLVIDPGLGNDIYGVGKYVEGCFAEDSNVNDVLASVYNTDTNLKQITFTFNEVEIKATAITTADEIVKQLYDGYEVARIKREAEYEEYKKTPQYKIDVAEKARKDAERKIIEDEVIRIDETTEMEFKDKDGWDKTVEVNFDGYGGGVITYARRFAKCMQDRISKGSSVVEAANEFQYNADLEGITGFMYGCAINILSQTWKYGEELRKWHNKDYGHDGDGVVNPSVLTIS